MNENDIQTLMQNSWDKIAVSFDKTRTHPWKTCIDFIEKLPKESIVGDFACGNGRHSFALASHCSQIINIDISQNLLKIIKEKNKYFSSIHLVHSNLLNVPLIPNCLDAVLYIAAIHNIPGKKNRIQSIRELFRVLKPGGTALISVWSRNQEKFNKNTHTHLQHNEKTIIQEPGDIIIYWNQNNLHVPRFYHLYHKKEIIDEVNKVGFKIICISEESISTKNKPDNYFITIRK